MNEEKKVDGAQAPQQEIQKHEDPAAQIEAEKQELYEQQNDVFKRMSAYDGQLREEKKLRQFSGKNAILTALLVLVVALALVFIVPMLLPEETVEEPVATSTARPYTFSERVKADVSSVTLYQDGEVLRLAKNVAGEYVATDYPDAQLNQTSAGSVFFAFASLNAVDTVADDSSRKADFGLEDPAYYAQVSYSDGTQATYYLGDRAPTGSYYYFMAEGNDAIYMVATSVNTYMRRTLLELQEVSDLPEIDYTALDHVLIRNAGGTIELKAYPDDYINHGVNNWGMYQPYRCDMDNEGYSAFTESISALSVKSYVGKVADLAEYGLDEAQASYLYLHDVNGVELEITIGGKRNSSEYYALIGDASQDVCTIGYAAAEAVLNAQPLTFVESFAGIVTLSLVDAFEVYLPDGTVAEVTIEREKQYDENNQLKTLANGQPDYLETYRINGKEYDNDTFKELYQAIIGVTIDGIVETDESGAPKGVDDQTYAKIVYHFNVALDDLTVEYRPYKSLYYAVNKGDGFNFYVAGSKLDRALDGLTQLLAQ